MAESKRKKGETPKEQTEEAKEEKEPEKPEDEAQRVPGIFVPLSELDVPKAIQLTIGILSEQAWVYMGLVPHPHTQQIQKDMNQAKLAIDTIAVLVEQIKPHIKESDYEQYRGRLTTLRVNFVEQSAKKS